MTYKTGEKPGSGTYICVDKGHKVILDGDNDTLPPCPFCHCTEFTKV